MKGAARGGWPPRAQHSSLRREERSREAFMERYVGLDLSRKRLNWCWVDDRCEVVGEGAVAPHPHGLARLVLELGEDVVAVIESMTGARFIHDQLELDVWDVRVVDAQRATALSGLACKTD